MDELQRWASAKYSDVKKSAKRRNIPFELNRDEFIEMVMSSNGTCSLTNLPFDFTPSETSKYRPWAPSVDRIDHREGYSLGNCRLVCIIVNNALNQFSVDELERMSYALLNRP